MAGFFKGFLGFLEGSVVFSTVSIVFSGVSKVFYRASLDLCLVLVQRLLFGFYSRFLDVLG